MAAFVNTPLRFPVGFHGRLRNRTSVCQHVFPRLRRFTTTPTSMSLEQDDSPANPTPTPQVDIRDADVGISLEGMADSKFATAIITEIRNIPSRPVFYTFVVIGGLSALIALIVSSSVVSSLDHLPLIPDILRVVSSTHLKRWFWHQHRHHQPSRLQSCHPY